MHKQIKLPITNTKETRLIFLAGVESQHVPDTASSEKIHTIDHKKVNDRLMKKQSLKLAIEMSTDEKMTEKKKMELDQAIDKEFKRSDAFKRGMDKIQNPEKKKNASLVELRTLATKKEGREAMKNSFLEGEIKEGEILKVDFGNQAAERGIGAGDLLPDNVREITVTNKDGVKMKGYRAPSPENPFPRRVGYYTEGGRYVPIFSGDTIQIDNIATKEEMATIKEGTRKAFQRDESIPKELRESLKGRPLEEIENAVHENYLEEIEEQEKAMEEIRKKYGVQETGDFVKDFINIAKAIAKDIEEKFGIPWEVTVAQTALETGMGKHAPNNNFFGIKGFGELLKTTEVVNGKAITITDSFSKYNSPVDSFMAYARLLTTSPRYRPIIEEHRKNPMTPKDFLQKIISAGYATDPHYVAKATSLMSQQGISMYA